MHRIPQQVRYEDLSEAAKRQLNPPKSSTSNVMINLALAEQQKEGQFWQRVSELEQSPEVTAFAQFLDALPLRERNTILKRLEQQ